MPLKKCGSQDTPKLSLELLVSYTLQNSYLYLNYLFILGNCLENDLQEFLASGANFVFPKPVPLDQLDHLLDYIAEHGADIGNNICN